LPVTVTVVGDGLAISLRSAAPVQRFEVAPELRLVLGQIRKVAIRQRDATCCAGADLSPITRVNGVRVAGFGQFPGKGSPSGAALWKLVETLQALVL